MFCAFYIFVDAAWESQAAWEMGCLFTVGRVAYTVDVKESEMGFEYIVYVILKSA